MTVAARPGAPDGERTLSVDGALDIRRTLAIHRRGSGDPTLRFEASGSAWRASRTPEGPATLFIEAGHRRHPGPGVGTGVGVGAGQVGRAGGPR